ncbi:hypothetical protein [Ornithinibacillus contaminans]|uniref:hypothetical protein n=1 Tax=Ornithinibacillus contaminans TaxID=694055 RepID=UPI00064E062B|nr:hypothetical protein [Ornithinibacillus contaminans]
MKKYIIFALSFIVLFSVFQVLSGFFLTLIYTPDMADAWKLSSNLSKETSISGHSSYLLAFVIAFLSATIAYFVPKMMKDKNNN